MHYKMCGFDSVLFTRRRYTHSRICRHCMLYFHSSLWGLVSRMTLLLDGANAEAHPIKAAMKIVEIIVVAMVYLYFDGGGVVASMVAKK